MGTEFQLALMFGEVVAVVVAISAFRRFKLYRVDTAGRPCENALALSVRAGLVIGVTAMIGTWIVLTLLI
ncbi:MAG: hypothetical protein GEU80_15175 [Dehalococcoidia bacterium]|nr:hypothetical protein [Dehalococcoidia bacterium]